jgi:DNA-binding PadR family transcriptional regulator
VRHSFNTEVASDVGVHAAIILDNIAYWVRHNYRAGRNGHDGSYWTYGTHNEIAAQFEYLSPKQVRTALDKLVTAGYIRVGRYNKHKYDRTSWYTLTDKGESIFPYRLELEPKRAEGVARIGRPIPNIKPDIKQDIKTRADALKERLRG